MYKKIAQQITNIFVDNGSITKEKSNIYTYGFEVLISTIVYMIIFIAVAIATKTLLESLIFWLGFFIVRTIGGGFHANTYITCHILFSCVHLAFIAALRLLPVNTYNYAIIAFAVFSFTVLLFIAPVDHRNKRFTPHEHNRFKICSIVYAFVILSITPLFLKFHFINSSFFLSFMIGTFIATFSVLSAKIINKTKKEDLS